MLIFGSRFEYLFCLRLGFIFLALSQYYSSRNLIGGQSADISRLCEAANHRSIATPALLGKWHAVSPLPTSSGTLYQTSICKQQENYLLHTTVLSRRWYGMGTTATKVVPSWATRIN